MSNGESVELEGPFGVRARVWGRDIYILILGAVLVCLVLFAIYTHDKDNVAAVAAISKNQTILAANQTLLAERMDEMLYIMLLSDKKRAELNISMPDALRRRIHKSRQEEDEK